MVNSRGTPALQLAFLKVGGATFCYQSNIEGEMIKLLGDWSSYCYKQYVDVSAEKRFDSMKALVDALNNFTCE